ncbi:hypothetical protein AB0A74_11235 [Saccharothrix sp. NPDC042600]|uniref:sunset domain-containing protein n=1 Tax=Saccharothrix TaxID=2071 RepID=UPI003405DDBB|nr:hypothetical protein GCM10017745_70540 [Saccharothrix mutabilis subsp. capreolus]
MFWLFAQMFVLCGFAFLAGAVLTWLPLRATIRGLRAELTHPTTPPRPALPAGTLTLPTQPKPAPENADEPEPAPEAEPEPEPDHPTAALAALAAQPTPEPAPVPDAEPAPAASATAGVTSAKVAPAGVTPAAVVEVKGSSKSMIFHTPDSPYFKRMKGDVTFRSIAEAEEAGYTQWRPRSAAQVR